MPLDPARDRQEDSAPIDAAPIEPAEAKPVEPAQAIPTDIDTPATVEPPEPPAPAATPIQTETLVTPAPETESSVSEPVPEPQQTSSQSQHSNPAPVSVALRGDIAKARAKIQETKRKKLDKIMAKLAEKGRITNDEAEKLLRVSDSTATRYLKTLKKENKIKQAGRAGRAVFYEKIQF